MLTALRFKRELGADEDLVDSSSVEEDLIIIDDEDLDKDLDEERRWRTPVSVRRQ